jgi:hypothetical protein
LYDCNDTEAAGGIFEGQISTLTTLNIAMGNMISASVRANVQNTHLDVIIIKMGEESSAHKQNGTRVALQVDTRSRASEHGKLQSFSSPVFIDIQDCGLETSLASTN